MTKYSGVKPGQVTILTQHAVVEMTLPNMLRDSHKIPVGGEATVEFTDGRVLRISVEHRSEHYIVQLGKSKVTHQARLNKTNASYFVLTCDGRSVAKRQLTVLDVDPPLPTCQRCMKQILG